MNNEVGYQLSGQGLCEVPAFHVKSIDLEKRQIRVLASSSALDRHGEKILPQAFEDSLKRFMDNPVVLAAHHHRLDDGSPAVIGKVIRIWIDKAGLRCVIEFARTALAESYWVLYRDGFMNAVSVGFVAKDGEWVQEGGQRLYVHTKVELLEISCVPVPSNPEALVRTGGGNAWLEQKKEEREDKKFWRQFEAEHPDFDADCEEFTRLLMSGDPIEDLELSDNDEGEGEDVNFGALVKAGVHLDQPVADLPCGCDWIADALREDAVGACKSFRIGERDRLAPLSTSEFDNLRGLICH